MKKRNIKTIVAVVLAVVILAGAGAGAFLLSRRGGSPVKVYPLTAIAQTDMWMEDVPYDGTVRAENLQSVYLSDTQQLKEVFVRPGDAVKKGDRLAAFDTTLSDLELERQRIEVQKLELSVTEKQAELRRVNALKPYTPPAAQPEPATRQEPATQPLDPVALPVRLRGDGSAEAPFVYLWNDACAYDEDFIAEILPLREAPAAEPPAEEAPAEEEPAEEEPAEEGQEAAVLYEEHTVTVVFQVREYDNPGGELLRTWGMTFDRHADGGYSFTVFEPEADFDETEETTAAAPDPEPDEGGYTAAEIARMRSETQQDIRDAETKLKVERLKLKKLELEINTGVVTATLDGVVKSVATEEEARAENRPVVTVSAGGAWYISANVGELDLENISVGEAAEIESWMNEGSVCSGRVVAISQTPVSGGYANGNPNVSFYPVTVEADESALLQEGDYVSVRFGSASGGAGLYLDMPFIRSENGRSFVFVMDENGRLAKREIATGKIYWGTTVEITGGLTVDDAIAFPYGKDVKDGAKAALSDGSPYEY